MICVFEVARRAQAELQFYQLTRLNWGDSMVKTFQVYLGVTGGGTSRCSSSSTSSSGGTDSPDATVVDERTYSCIHCRAHLARHEDLISKSFQGTQGRAYLFEAVVNVSCGKPEERLLLTGESISTCACLKDWWVPKSPCRWCEVRVTGCLCPQLYRHRYPVRTGFSRGRNVAHCLDFALCTHPQFAKLAGAPARRMLRRLLSHLASIHSAILSVFKVDDALSGGKEYIFSADQLSTLF
ncbi:Protein yippee-like 1 [Taenia solium]|eukprot:TsM_001222700 transcript=TsM_001222700 gene=TsM_001222700